jgi:hypothetical protein
MTFHESAEQGDILNSLQIGIVYGALWAIGSSWSTAIRETVITLVPNDSDNRVFAELGAAALTTMFGVGVSVLATRSCAKICTAKQTQPKTQTQLITQTLPTRRF